MPQRSKSNETEASNKGNPSDKGKSKASIKDVKDKEELEREDEIRDKYTDENNDPDPEAVRVTNPNRNTDKPEIDKPPYGSSK